MSRPTAARKAPKGEYIETVSKNINRTATLVMNVKPLLFFFFILTRIFTSIYLPDQLISSVFISIFSTTENAFALLRREIAKSASPAS